MKKIIKELLLIVKTRYFINNKKNKEKYDYIKQGDLIFSIMPLPLLTLLKIPCNHRSRPYIVVRKCEDGFYGYPCSSQCKSRITTGRHMILNDKVKYLDTNNNLKIRYKKSIINFNKIHFIPYKNIIGYHSSLASFELDEFIRLTEINARKNHHNIYIKNKDVKAINWNIICINNNLYLIEKSDNSLLYCYKLCTKKHEDSYQIVINKKTYYIDFNEQFKFPNIKYPIIDYINGLQQNEILEAKKSYKLNHKKVSKTISKHISQNIPKYYMEYEIGTEFVNRFNNESFIYLYSLNGDRYGVLGNNKDISKLRDQYNVFDKIEVVDPDEIYDILHYFKNNIISNILSILTNRDGYLDFNLTAFLPQKRVY